MPPPIHHEQLGTLTWEGDELRGSVHLASVQAAVPIWISSDLKTPTEGDLLAVVETAAALVSQLSPGVLERMAGRAAHDVMEAVVAQEGGAPQAVEVKQFQAELVLQGLHFTADSVMLIWDAAQSFPGQRITAQCSADLEVVEVMVQE